MKRPRPRIRPRALARRGACLVSTALAACVWAPSALAESPKAKPGSVVLQIIAAPKPGTTPGDGAAPGRTDYGYPEGDQSPYEGVNYTRLEDVVVWLERAEGNANEGANTSAKESASAASAAPVQIDIRPRRPSGADGVPPTPPVIAVGVGQRVRFRNETGAEASVFSFAEGNTFRFRGVKQGASVEWVAAAPGEVEAVSSAADEPFAMIVVAPTRFVAKSRGGTEVTFTDVPSGAWAAKAWHRRIPSDPVHIEVAPGARAKATLRLSVEALPVAP